MLTNNYDWSTGTYSTDPKYTEILKLDKMLSDANIPHVTRKMFDGWQVCYPDTYQSGNDVADAVQHYGSYGADVNLLEITGLLTPDEEENDGVLGWITAEHVFERINEHYNSAHPSEESTPDNPTTETPVTEEITHRSGKYPWGTEPNTTPLTPEEFTKQMREAFDVYYLEQHDEEVVHGVMDDIMCDLLCQLGYGDGVDIFRNTPKWYS